MIVGYARISTVDQEAGLEAQKRDLIAAGCMKVFDERLSSVDTSRPELARALEFVRERDTLVVAKLDRLARSVAGFVNIAEDLEHKKAALSRWTWRAARLARVCKALAPSLAVGYGFFAR